MKPLSPIHNPMYKQRFRVRKGADPLLPWEVQMQVGTLWTTTIAKFLCDGNAYAFRDRMTAHISALASPKGEGGAAR